MRAPLRFNKSLPVAVMDVTTRGAAAKAAKRPCMDPSTARFTVAVASSRSGSDKKAASGGGPGGCTGEGGVM